MVSKLNRREFIKTASLAALSLAVPLEVFAAAKTGADLV
ncbi:MAG: twin-arginine translocation signal domain-containing protein, partial [Selenomonadaceae bacterium]|nr:twin-arginine translocation signal domain-containing protein [Selenomonadaceae bacterium]